MKTIINFVLLTTLLGAKGLDNTGTIKGMVQNADNGDLLPMSLVFIHSSDSALPPRSFFTRTGSFAIVGVPSGMYRAFVYHQGFQSFVAQKVYVKPDTVTQLEFLLRPVKTRADSTDVVRPGSPGIDYKMKFFKPDIKKFK